MTWWRGRTGCERWLINRPTSGRDAGVSREGARVVVGDLNLAAAKGSRESPVRGHGGEQHFDASRLVAVAALMARAVTEYGGIDGGMPMRWICRPDPSVLR